MHEIFIHFGLNFADLNHFAIKKYDLYAKMFAEFRTDERIEFYYTSEIIFFSVFC